MSIRIAAALLAAVIALAAAPPVAAQSPSPSPPNPPTVVAQPAMLPGVPVWDGTALRRVLLRDETGPRALLLEIARGNRVPPHAHPFPDLALIVVVRGPVHYADGTQFDEAKLQAFPAGSLLLVPKDNIHFVSARENDVLLLALPAAQAWLPAELAARLAAR